MKCGRLLGLGLTSGNKCQGLGEGRLGLAFCLKPPKRWDVLVAVRVVVLRGVVSTIGFELATLGLTFAVVTSIARFGLTVSDVQ